MGVFIYEVDATDLSSFQTSSIIAMIRLAIGRQSSGREIRHCRFNCHEYQRGPGDIKLN